MKSAMRQHAKEGRSRRRSRGGPDFRALFQALPDPCLVLDRRLQIVTVNEAYLKATLTTRPQIVGRSILDLFPGNPAGRGVSNLSESLSRVLKSGMAESIPLQRFQIPSPSGGFEERHWTAVTTPLFGADGGVSHLIHRLQDVTGYSLSSPMVPGAQLGGTDDAAEARRELERTVAALREKANLFAAFMDHLPAAAWMKDMTGCYVFANAETERLFSTSIASLLGKRSEEVFPPDVASQFFEIDRRVLDDGGNVTPIEVVRQGEGVDRHLLVSKFVIRDADSRPRFLAGVALDVTETRRLEEEVERLASFPLVNPNPVLEFDFEGKVTFCNPAAKALLAATGCSEESNPFIPDDLPLIIRDLREQRIEQYACEVDIHGKSYEELISLLPQQKVVRCYTLDVTRRKRAEREREQLLLQLQAVLDSINEGVVISDLAGNVLTMNKEALALHGFNDVDQVRMHVAKFEAAFELSTLRGEKLGLEEWPLMRALRGERFFDYELRLTLRSTGNASMISYNGTPVTNPEGTAILAVITSRDVTSRRAMEEEIVRLNADLKAQVAELEQTNQELEAFNRMVSHDLRQPLNTIGTSCQTMQMLCDLDEDCRKYVDIAYHKVLLMNDLIESLLKFSRSTHTELRHERVDLSQLARMIFADIKVAEPGRRVTLAVADGLAAEGDPRLLRSVLENLIGNAWKYTAERDDAVIEFGTVKKDGKETFFVRDNGRGFRSSEVEQLFAPFKRLPGSEQYRGFGIGLATVYRIVQRHGGEVCADAEPGKGATFYFTLPATADENSGGVS